MHMIRKLTCPSAAVGAAFQVRLTVGITVAPLDAEGG